MYHPSKYKEHNQSLKRFVEKFNEVGLGIDSKIKMIVREYENYIDDAIIYDELTQQAFAIDWEKRHSYYETCGFPFETFGQFERKISKEEIKLSIQCSKDERCCCIAWHEDFKKESAENVNSVTESGIKENTPKRFTDKFIEIKYDELYKFHEILRKAFDQKKFNHEVFF